MKLARDFTAGIAASILSMAAALVAVPFLLRYLGTEAYGLIGFSTALQSFLMLLDLGLSPTISRHVARASVSGDLGGARTLLRSLAWIYWSIALVIGAGLALAAPLLAGKWLNLHALEPGEVAGAIMLMGLQIAFRWPSALYLGALTGAHRLVSASMISGVYYLLANIGAIGIVVLWSPTLHAVFLWQAVVSLGYTLALQRAAWTAIGGAADARFDWQALGRIWGFSAGMTGVALASVLLTQLDKIILSKLVSLEAFSHYMLAALAVGSLYRILSPLFSTIYPRFSALVTRGDSGNLDVLYRISSTLFASFWFPGIMFMIVCSRPLLFLWTGNSVIAAESAQIFSLLALATGIHGIMHFPYALQLAYGASRLTLKIHLFLAAIQLPTVVILVLAFGVTGGAIAAVVLYVTYFVVGFTMTHNRFLPGVRWHWILVDLGRPLLVTASFAGASQLILPAFERSSMGQIAIGLGLALLAVLVALAASPYRVSQIRAALEV